MIPKISGFCLLKEEKKRLYFPSLILIAHNAHKFSIASAWNVVWSPLSRSHSPHSSMSCSFASLSVSTSSLLLSSSPHQILPNSVYKIRMFEIYTEARRWRRRHWFYFPQNPKRVNGWFSYKYLHKLRWMNEAHSWIWAKWIQTQNNADEKRRTKRTFCARESH